MKPLGLDALGERLTRGLARGVSRRSLLARFGAIASAGAAFPLLPVDRRALAAEGPRLDAFAEQAQVKDDKLCNYWRYCAIDGNLCTCCGGGLHSCPPGTRPSETSWVGTCFNPTDQRSYIVSYRDCCGTPQCSRCGCNEGQGASPIYRPQGNNDIIWCFGTGAMEYHCSTAALVGVAG